MISKTTRMKHTTHVWNALVLGSLFALGACQHPAATSSSHQLAFDSAQAGLTLPAGFQVVVVAHDLGRIRHLAIRDNGDIYAALNSQNHGGGIVALRDTTGDGVADVVDYFGQGAGTGMALHKGYLYFATNTQVLRYKMIPGQLLPDTNHVDTIATLPVQDEHEMKSMAFDDSGYLYVNVGAPSNACQFDDRTKGSPGQMPCPLLKEHAGVWRFRDDSLNQTEQHGGYRYVTGTRNCVALAYNSSAQKVYAVMHGRDQLAQLFPQYYTDSSSALLPAEEFLEFHDGANFGWPYVYYDQIQKKLVTCPEYGGDGKKGPKPGTYEDPIMAFPGHWAPDGLLFYTGSQFPNSYAHGAFIAFHGSWNRAPLPQGGYKVVYVPFSGDKPSGPYQVFADGFSGVKILQNPGDAKHRPTGLAQGPDGSLYVSDDAHGYIFRIVYTGK